MPKKTRYKRMTLTQFNKKLRGGGYSTWKAAVAAISRSALTDQDKASATDLAKKYFEASKKLPTPPKSTKKPQATRSMTRASAPFCVVFAKTVRNKDASALLLNFMRGAADSGMTLPELIEAIEAV